MVDANVLVSYLAFRYEVDLEIIPEDHPLVAPTPPSEEEIRRQREIAVAAAAAKQESCPGLQFHERGFPPPGVAHHLPWVAGRLGGL